jgi:hypothetical protein
MHKTDEMCVRDGTACIPTILDADYICLLEGFWDSDTHKIWSTYVYQCVEAN